MTVHHVSASQIETWRLCPRKWAYQKIKGLKESTEATEFGSDMHSILGDYFSGKHADFTSRPGKVALKGISEWPTPDEFHVEDTPESPVLIRCEQSSTVVLGDGHTYKLTEDLVYSEFVKDSDCYLPWELVLGDHKSCKDFTYAPKPVDLDTNVQTVIYSHNLFVGLLSELDGHRQAVKARWNYYPKATHLRASRMVERYLYPDRTAYEFEKIDKDAAGILKAREQWEFEDYPKNLRACKKYGGCPFAADCLSFLEKVKSYNAKPNSITMEQTDMGLLERMQQEQAEKKAEEPTPPSPAAALNPPEAKDAEPVASPPEEKAEAEPEKEEEPKKRKRRTSEEVKAEKLAEARKLLAEEGEVADQPNPGCTPKMLLLNTLPTTLPFRSVSLTPWLAELDLRFCEEYKAAHGETLSSYRQVEYGKGPAAFEAFVRKELEEKGDSFTAAVGTAADVRVRDCLAPLMAWADVVIQGGAH